MAVGEWVDNRFTFFFQKLALSADVDSLAENDHRLLVAAGHRWSDDSVQSHVSWNDTQGYLDIGASVTINSFFTFALEDREPWNRIRLAVFAHSFNAVGGTVTLYIMRPPDEPGGGATPELIITLTIHSGVLSVAQWLEGTYAIPTGAITGYYQFKVEYATPGGGALIVTEAVVDLMSTVTGLVV